MFRSLPRLSLALWHLVRRAPLSMVRLATAATFMAAILGYGLITFDARLVAGPITEFLPGEAGGLSLARVDLPGLPSRFLAFQPDPALAEIRPGRSWVLGYGVEMVHGADRFLAVDRFVLADSRPDPRAWLPDSAQTAPWILVAAGIAALLLAAPTRILTTAAAMAGLGAAIAWHGLHAAGFMGWEDDVGALQPVLIMAGLVLGAALGTRTAVAAPTGLTVRLAAAVAAFMLLPWGIDTLALPEGPALLMPLICLAIPALLPALAATLLAIEGLGQQSPEVARSLLAGAVLVALLLARYSHITDPYLSSMPVVNPPTPESGRK